MNVIAVLATIIVGYLTTWFTPGPLASVFAIATMGYFILKKIDVINSEKK